MQLRNIKPVHATHLLGIMQHQKTHQWLDQIALSLIACFEENPS